MNHYYDKPIAPPRYYYDTTTGPGSIAPGLESMTQGQSCRCLEETPYRRRFTVSTRAGLTYEVQATHVQISQALPYLLAFWDYDLKVEMAWVPVADVAFIISERM